MKILKLHLSRTFNAYLRYVKALSKVKFAIFSHFIVEKWVKSVNKAGQGTRSFVSFPAVWPSAVSHELGCRVLLVEVEPAALSFFLQTCLINEQYA